MHRKRKLLTNGYGQAFVLSQLEENYQANGLSGLLRSLCQLAAAFPCFDGRKLGVSALRHSPTGLL